MEINKQLFKDVLLGKLKGTFVLRSGETYFSDGLHRNYNKFRNTHPYAISFGSYTPKGMFLEYGRSQFDIVDFIPDVDMKENELTIEIPNDKIVDWKESEKQNKIVFKSKQLTYEDVCKKLFDGKDFYFVCGTNSIVKGKASDSDITHFLSDANNAPSKHQLECILAKNQLTNCALYLNNGWKPKSRDIVCGLMLEGENCSIIFPIYYWNTNKYYLPQFVFKSEKLAQQAIEILGEETVKLALEPLGI